MKALMYVRVSKEEEDVENQRIAIKRFARENGYRIVNEFPDEDVSGWKVQILKRKGFNELLQYAEEKNIKTILIFDVTRFGRNWKDVLGTYMLLDDQGYDIIFTLQPFLRLSFYYEMFSSIEDMEFRKFLAETSFYEALKNFAQMAEFESVITHVRTIKGLEKARAQGKKIGRPKISPEIQEMIIKLYEKGYTYEDIRKVILQAKIYFDKDGKPRAPSLSTISNIIADYLKES